MTTWDQQARTLCIGSKRKVECCSADPSATISNSHHGVSFYCHRCHHKDFKPHGVRSIAEILATRQAVDVLSNQRTPVMPGDAVALADGPQAAWQWVLRGGLTPEEATDTYGMRWHEKTRRVILPITKAGKCVALLGRAVHGERPKYRMLSGKADTFYRPAHTTGNAVVVVEDALSAIAVQRSGINAVAVLGTAITPEHAAEIAVGAGVVVGWFDADKAGDTAWQRLRKRMALYPVRLVQIRTAEDPKILHRQALREVLQEHIGA